jgi:hypothetical protein
LVREPQIIQDFEHEPCGPLRYPTPQGEGDRGSFQYLVSAGAKLSSLADVVLNSAITCLGNAYAQSNQFLVLPLKAARLEDICLELFHLLEGADAALKHLVVVLLPCFSNFTYVLEHVIAS